MAGLVRLATSARSNGLETVRFFPYLAGSGAPNPDSTRRAQLRGLAEASNRADVAFAVLDGIASEMACQVAEMRALGVPVDEVVVSGGLASIGPLVHAFAERLDAHVWRSDVVEGSAVGAALLALDGVGLAGDARVGATRVRVGSTKRRALDETWLRERDAIMRGARA